MFLQDSTAGSGEIIKTEEEEILVYVNVDDANDDFIAEDLESFKVIGLDTDEPIIQVGDKVTRISHFWVSKGNLIYFEIVS